MESNWLAFTALVLGILLLLKFWPGKKHNKKIMRFCTKWHKPLAVVMLAAGLIHGMIAIFEGAYPAAVIASGILLVGSALFVCLTYGLRSRRMRTWLKLHKGGAVVFALLLLLHTVLAQVI